SLGQLQGSCPQYPQTLLLFIFILFILFLIKELNFSIQLARINTEGRRQRAEDRGQQEEKSSA
ncbi:MAG: hypothetical protein AB1414_06435, partial [bacterium]